VDCWDAFRWNVLSQTYTAQSSRRATYTICRHIYYTISQGPFGHITLVGYIPIKYYIILVTVEQLMLLIVNMLDDMNTWKQIVDIHVM